MTAAGAKSAGAVADAGVARRRLSARRLGWIAVLAVTAAASVAAATVTRPPATESERAFELKEATLCPVCDGQSVLESNAPVAAAMRQQIDAWVDAGRSDDEVRAALATAYGDDVNALPPGSGVGTLVWAAPVAVFAAAVAGLWAAMRAWRRREHEPESPTSGAPATEASASGASAFGNSTPGTSAMKTLSTSRRSASVATSATIAAVVLVGIAAGVFVARSTGLRLGGETLTGDIDRSARSMLLDAQRQFAANQLGDARVTLGEISRIERDLRGALLLSARVHLRVCELASSSSDSDLSEYGLNTEAGDGCDVQAALIDLDRVLAENPDDTEALALRGWLLIRLPDPELTAAGIAALDAAVALDPSEFDPWLFRGYAARYLEADLEAAISFYRSALERGPPPAMSAALQSAVDEMSAELADQ